MAWYESLPRTTQTSIAQSATKHTLTQVYFLPLSRPSLTQNLTDSGHLCSLGKLLPCLQAALGLQMLRYSFCLQIANCLISSPQALKLLQMEW